MKSLTEAPPNTPVFIAQIQGDSEVTRRLRELGFQNGGEVRVLGRAPLRGPFVVEVHDSVIALREFEAECIKIK